MEDERQGPEPDTIQPADPNTQEGGEEGDGEDDGESESEEARAETEPERLKREAEERANGPAFP